MTVKEAIILSINKVRELSQQNKIEYGNFFLFGQDGVLDSIQFFQFINELSLLLKEQKLEVNIVSRIANLNPDDYRKIKDFERVLGQGDN